MNQDLYEKLGVRQNATQAEIKAAAKKRRRETHPDAGGSKEEFQEVSTAVSVLLDPAKRALYDRAGVIRDGSDVETQRMALAIVEQHLAALINDFVGNGFSPAMDPRRLDIPKVIRTRILSEVGGAEKHLTTGNLHLKFLKDFQRRLKIKKKGPEGDLLNNALQRQIEMAEGDIANCRESIRLRWLAVELIENYSFEREVIPTAFSSAGAFGPITLRFS